MKPKIAPKELQPKSFAFSKANQAEIKKILAKYPSNQKQSGVMPLLDLAQRQEGWISEVAMKEIAEILEMPQIKVFEVATFYSMYHLAPVGKYHLQVCTTTPCWLCGSANLQKLIKDKIGISKNGEVSKDGVFSIEEVECLGACVNAPVVQVNDDYYEDLDEESLNVLLDDLAKGKPPKRGSLKGRVQSMPKSGPTVLKELAKQVGVSSPKEKVASKPVEKKTVEKKETKKVSAKKASAKKATVKKVPVKKVVAKKTVAKKSTKKGRSK